MKPCPFCRSSKIKIEQTPPTEVPSQHTAEAFVECQDCKARGPVVTDWLKPKFREIAAQRWDGINVDRE